MSDTYMGNYRFGNNSVLPVDVLYVTPGGDVAARTTPLYARNLARMNGDDFSDAARDLGETAMILEGPEVDGRPTSVEISIAQTKGTKANGFDAQFSTGSSSLHNNPLQVAEVAMRSAETPHNQMVYVTHPGQGGSSPWAPEEAKYIKETGRYTQPDGTPLPTMQAYAKALEGEGIEIRRVSCDADGASIATGFLVAHNAEVQNIHFNGAPIADGSVVKDEIVNQIDDCFTALLSDDGARLTKYQVQEAGRLFEAGLGDRAEHLEMQRTLLQKARTSHTPQKLSLVAAGLSRQVDEEGVHPSVLDTVALVDRHPEACIVFSMVQKAMSAKEGVNFLARLKERVQDPRAATHVQIVRTPGTRRDHKAYPTKRRAIKQFAYFQRTYELEA